MYSACKVNEKRQKNVSNMFRFLRTMSQSPHKIETNVKNKGKVWSYQGKDVPLLRFNTIQSITIKNE